MKNDAVMERSEELDPIDMATIKQLLADNKFDWINSEITDEHFPIEKELSTDGAVLEKHVEKHKEYISTEAVLADLNKRGRRAATAAELLMYWLENTEILKYEFIASLGQVWNGQVLVLGKYGARRGAFLRRIAFVWGASYRFLSFPQENSALGTSDTQSGARTLGHCPHCDKALEPEFIVKEYEYLRDCS